jgi:hypothetical protein
MPPILDSLLWQPAQYRSRNSCLDSEELAAAATDAAAAIVDTTIAATARNGWRLWLPHPNNLTLRALCLPQNTSFSASWTLRGPFDCPVMIPKFEPFTCRPRER